MKKKIPLYRYFVPYDKNYVRLITLHPQILRKCLDVIVSNKIATKKLLLCCQVISLMVLDVIERCENIKSRNGNILSS